MLPWDRLAQYVVLTTTEWMDALPVFNGILTRNFISNEAITDRLFSLLSFMHIGIPLVLLLALWVHTQRVPRASMVPPRPLAIGLSAMLVVLSLARPVVSQGPADFSSVPGELQFDWYYLSVYPLVHAWDPISLWIACAVAAAVLVALPWLPPARTRGAAVMRMTAHPGRQSAPVRRGETLLDAGLRAGILLPYECRSGGCGLCKATMIGGDVEMSGYQPSALSEDERRAGRVLLCCARALSDVEFETEENAAARGATVELYETRVERLEPLAHDVMLVALRLRRGRARSPTKRVSTSTSCSTTTRAGAIRSPARRAAPRSSSCRCEGSPAGDSPAWCSTPCAWATHCASKDRSDRSCCTSRATNR